MIEDSSSSSQWVWKAGRWQSDILAAIVIINDSGNAADPDCSIACMEQVLVMEPLSTNWRDEAAFACLDKSVSGDNHKLKLSMTPWRNILVGGKQPITASLHLSFSSKREGAAKWWGKHMSIQKWIYHYQIWMTSSSGHQNELKKMTSKTPSESIFQECCLALLTIFKILAESIRGQNRFELSSPVLQSSLY
mgnify:CR=1 FL=1